MIRFNLSYFRQLLSLRIPIAKMYSIGLLSAQHILLIYRKIKKKKKYKFFVPSTLYCLLMTFFTTLHVNSYHEIYLPTFVLKIVEYVCRI